MSSKDTMKYQTIPEFYDNKSIFITGGTGFVGKVLIEKLLYDCPNVKCIYMLIRQKKGSTAVTRVDEIINSAIFCRLKENNPEAFLKIKPVPGNITEPNLGISEKDITAITNEVSVVFHSAATVKFDETLRDAFAFNVGGTREVLNVCHKMKKLQALIHVSTAYSNFGRSIIDEVVYEPWTDISTVEYLAKFDNERITQQLKGKHANTYTFTKSLGEHCVATTHGDIPVAIVRPSIVLSPLHGPAKGWICNWNGPNGLVAATLMKTLGSVLGDVNCTSDLIPVDIVANLIILSASRLQKPGELVVYNCCSGTSNPILWGEFTDIITKCICRNSKNNNSKLDYSKDLLLPCVKMTNNFYRYWLMTFMFQIFPAFCIYMFQILTKGKSRAMEMQRRIQIHMTQTESITKRQWTFVDKNFRTLIDTMSPKEKQTFDIDVKNINWEAYLKSYTLGVKKYLLKIE